MELWDYVHRDYYCSGLLNKLLKSSKKYPNEGHMRISHEAIYTYLYVMPKANSETIIGEVAS